MDSYLISHLTLRKLLGVLGISMPFILILGVYILKQIFKVEIGDTVVQPSISHYYYTAMGDVFVGIVMAFGLFLFTYKGYREEKFWKRDNVFTNAAGFCAVLVALFPTNELDDCVKFHCYVHFTAAVLFFLILAYISLVLFTQSALPPKLRKGRKVTRNRVYRIMGVIMLSCIVILTIYYLWFKATWPYYTTFVFESIALIAFGFSWLTKGEAILKDK